MFLSSTVLISSLQFFKKLIEYSFIFMTLWELFPVTYQLHKLLKLWKFPSLSAPSHDLLPCVSSYNLLIRTVAIGFGAQYDLMLTHCICKDSSSKQCHLGGHKFGRNSIQPSILSHYILNYTRTETACFWSIWYSYHPSVQIFNTYTVMNSTHFKFDYKYILVFVARVSRQNMDLPVQ